jgi:hypothetical protein
MNIARKVTASLLVAVLVSAIWATAGLSQTREGNQPQPREDLSAGTQSRGRSREIGAEEKLVRDVYARLMRYQSAAQDELSARKGQSSKPQDYLTIELRDISSGPIEQLSDHPLSELVTPRSGAFIAIKPDHLSNGGPAHAYYQADWAQTSPAGKAADPTVGAVLRDRGASVNRYTSYEVTVRLRGQNRTYRAMAIYQFDKAMEDAAQDSAQKSFPPKAIEIWDNITSEMNTVLGDQSPPVKAPWSTYVQSSWYQAVTTDIMETQAAGSPLIPSDAPIGYLPGDNIASASATLNDPCPTTTVSITVSGVANADKATVGGLVVLNSDSNNALRQQITVEQAQPASYAGNVTLTRNSAKVKVFTAATNGSEITFNGTDNKFANSTLPRSFYVEGAAFSGTMRDVTLTVTSDDGATDHATFTVLWVDQPTVLFTGQLNPNNSARQVYINWTEAGWDQLGLQTYNASFGARFGWGTEASATVHPSNFAYPNYELRLDRDNAYHDWYDNGSGTIGQRNFNNTYPPGNDTGPIDAKDVDPQPNGTIYDWDAPGLALDAAPHNQIQRTRNNFKAYAVLCNGNLVNCDDDWHNFTNVPNGALIRSSQVRLYFVIFSMQQIGPSNGHNWAIIDPPDVSGDNQAGYGTTRLTWNLQ